MGELPDAAPTTTDSGADPRAPLDAASVPGTGRRIAMVAGEASGDLLAAAVLRGLRGLDPALDARGIGGPAMAGEGFEAWWSIEDLSVRGYVEVLAALPRLLRLRAELARKALAWRPDLFVGVDAPDFNLALERRLRAAGIAVVHFISPSIWAWRAERIEAIRSAVDHMLLVFPFEQEIYRKAGIDATYVGHPLADAIPLQVDQAGARRALGLELSRPTIALLPGSRASEVRHMADLFVDSAAWMHARRSDLQFVLPAAGTALYEQLRGRLAARHERDGLRLTLVQGRSHDALAAADAVLVASGTATLEAALYRRPMVIAYKMPWLSYRIMRNKGYLPWIGLPNILAGESLVPEFVQDAASAPALGAALLLQLEDDRGRARLAERFAQMHEQLRQDCAARASRVMLEIVDARRRSRAS
jgi:lipid-A-disaccharide synthase